MATLDTIFKREFKTSRNRLGEHLSLFELPLKKGNLPRVDFYRVLGIEDQYFSRLNNANVMIMRGTELERRLLNTRGEFRVDKTGKLLKEVVPVPRGSIAVLSKVRLGLPFKYKLDGYDYVDYIDSTNDRGEVISRKYIYILPKDKLYKTNLNALAISNRTMKAFSSIKIATWGVGFLYLNVIPYKPNRQYQNTVVLSVKNSLDFSKEISTVMGDLVRLGLISNPSEYVLETGENIAITQQPPAYDSFEYTPYEQSNLSKVSDQEFEEMINELDP